MRTRTLKSVLAGGVCALALTTAAHAENREFAVPAGELSQALDLYIRQSGEQLVYRVADVSCLKSPGVSGDLPAEDAADHQARPVRPDRRRQRGRPSPPVRKRRGGRR